MATAARARRTVRPTLILRGTSPLPATAHLVEAFRHGLRELGYVEGRNIAIEFRSAETRSERLPELAAELVRLGVDVIVAPGAEAARAAGNATRTIPIVINLKTAKAIGLTIPESVLLRADKLIE